MMKKLAVLLLSLVLTLGMSMSAFADSTTPQEAVDYQQKMEVIQAIEENVEVDGTITGVFGECEEAPDSAGEVAAAAYSARTLSRTLEDFFYPSPDMMYQGYKQNSTYTIEFFMGNITQSSTYEIVLSNDSEVLTSHVVYGAEKEPGEWIYSLTWKTSNLPAGEYYFETFLNGELTEMLPVYITTGNVLMTGLLLGSEYDEVAIGAETALSAVYQPVNTTDRYQVTWSCSDSSVLQLIEYDVINKGVSVVGLKAGTATITATAGGYSASYEIKVFDPEAAKAEIGEFVTRLYEVCLDRTPDADGKEYWVERLYNETCTGVEAAYGFVFSNEFLNKNLCNEDFVEQLYKAFMGRASDPTGKGYWVDNLKSGKTREEVFNGFALSKEFGDLCYTYYIVQGEGIDIPTYGTVPRGSCSICGAQDGVTAFVKRLYSICLDREADADGLADWTNQLWNHTNSGSGVAYGFIFSKEFTEKNYSDSDYVEYLYKAFMGRASDPAGKSDWLNRMSSKGWTRKQVFDGFVGSQEFTAICNEYGILRD